jgi:hypothetical protein
MDKKLKQKKLFIKLCKNLWTQVIPILSNTDENFQTALIAECEGEDELFIECFPFAKMKLQYLYGLDGGNALATYQQIKTLNEEELRTKTIPRFKIIWFEQVNQFYLTEYVPLLKPKLVVNIEIYNLLTEILKTKHTNILETIEI